MNGPPMVHVSLYALRDIRAFNQIDRYQRDSFWAGSARSSTCRLVISNGTLNKYYPTPPVASTSASGRFWRVRAPQLVRVHLVGGRDQPSHPDHCLARTFFAKHTPLNVLVSYCVFTADRLLLVMVSARSSPPSASSNGSRSPPTTSGSAFKRRRRLRLAHHRLATLTSLLRSSRPGWLADTSVFVVDRRTRITRPCASTTGARRAPPTPTRRPRC